MKIKICGMREPANIAAVAALQPDYMGFIFYQESARYVGENAAIPPVLPGIKRVGVFVNESIPYVLEVAAKYRLDVVQLHGEEDFEYCKIIRSNKLEVIKAISVADHLPVNKLMSYTDCVDYFLFDTITPYYGGSGKVFDWTILKSYHAAIPFFISGGLDLEHVAALQSIDHLQFAGVDANSRLETAPGIKDIERTKQFIKTIRNGTI